MFILSNSCYNLKFAISNIGILKIRFKALEYLEAVLKLEELSVTTIKSFKFQSNSRLNFYDILYCQQFTDYLNQK